MKNAIYELKSIAAMGGPTIAQMIEDWIDANIAECHTRILLSHPNNDEHKNFQIRKAMEELGVHIASNSNMFPSFKKEGKEMVCRMSALYFKNEFGK